MTDHATPLQVTQQAFLMYTNTFLLAVRLHLRSQMVFPSMDSAQTRPHQNAFCTLVYMIKCIMYLICVLYRMQWVLLCTPLASLMYFDVHKLALENPGIHERQFSQATRVSRFYESNESMSLSQIIKIIGKYISLCNSSALSHIEFIFGMEVLWDNRHQPHATLLW